MQIRKSLPINKTPGQYPRLGHKGNKTFEKARVNRKIITDGVTEQYPKSEIIRSFLTTKRAKVKRLIKRFFAVFTLILG